MQIGISIFPKYPWLSIYAWVVFCFLLSFSSSDHRSPIEIFIGICIIVLYFSCRIDFHSNRKVVTLYMWVSFEIVISVSMTLLFGYMYFSIFFAFFIGIFENNWFLSFIGFILQLPLLRLSQVFYIELELFLSQVHFSLSL